jgi:flavin-dependent dehydrogenase
LAYSQSGEGIRPAIESGLMAASVIANAHGQYDSKVLAAYDLLLDERFDPKTDFFTRLGKRLPTSVANAFAPLLMRSRRFASDIVLKQWFLHTDDPALRTALNVGTDASPAHVAK